MDPQNQTKSSSTKKAIIITAIIVAVMVIAAILLVVLLPKNNNEQDTPPEETSSFESDYSTTMKLYKSFNGKEILVEELEDEAEKQDASISVYVDDDKKGTIKIDDVENEYITFTQIQEEDDSPETAVDFVYHETIGDDDSFIFQSGEDAYQHFNGAITNEFKTIEEALDDHLLIHK